MGSQIFQPREDKPYSLRELYPLLLVLSSLFFCLERGTQYTMSINLMALRISTMVAEKKIKGSRISGQQ